MRGYYYVVTPSGDKCGHAHRGISPKLARCWREGTLYRRGRDGGKVATEPRLWHVGDDGRHSCVLGAALAPLRALLPTRGAGRPAGQTPLVAQAKPLYARLSVAERERYEALAVAAGIPDLGKYALHLLEQAAMEAAEKADPGARLLPMPPPTPWHDAPPRLDESVERKLRAVTESRVAGRRTRKLTE